MLWIGDSGRTIPRLIVPAHNRPARVPSVQSAGLTFMCVA